MSTATPIRAAIEIAKSTDHTGVGASFAVLGSALSNASHALVISSSLDVSAWISTDDTNEMILVLAGSTLTINVSGNKQGSGKLSFPIGTQFYIKQGPDGAPTSGDLALSSLYAR